MKNQLVKKIQEGDHEAFKDLFKSHYEDLCRFAFHYVNQIEIVEDLVQNVFFNIWKNHQNWRPQGAIQSYLYKAVHNQAINYVKHLRVKRKWEEEQSISNVRHESSSEAEWYGQEMSRNFNKALNQLPDRCRIIFVLNRVNGLKYAEIAETLGISIKTVEVQMGRALKKLYKLLRPFFNLF